MVLTAGVWAGGATRPAIAGATTTQLRLGQKFVLCSVSGSGVAILKLPNATSMIPDIDNFRVLIPTGSTTLDVRFTNWDDKTVEVFDRNGDGHGQIDLGNTSAWGPDQACVTCSLAANPTPAGTWFITFLGNGDA